VSAPTSIEGERPRSILDPPPGADGVPRFELGWLTAGQSRESFLSYVDISHAGNWSEGLEQLHEESSRTHFIDVQTRRAILARVPGLAAAPIVLDVGCSSGHLLNDLRGAGPDATLIGVDLGEGGLRRAHQRVPDAWLLQADVCAMPLVDESVDCVVSANLLEHVPNDELALSELFRILRPGGCAVIVVPVGPGNYDYYDRFLLHERRYARGELARKAGGVGLRTLDDLCLGALLYPAFRAVKRRNQRLYGELEGDALERKVARDLQSTGDSLAGRIACRLEDRLLSSGLRLPFGIRGLTVLERPRGAL
jgi:SAM-dependent methyltransferase